MSVSYLGLTREAGETGVAQVGWQDWYRYFPWEDRRAGVPALLDETIAPRLAAWCEAGADQGARRRQRADITFGERRGLERGHGAAALRAAVRGGPGARGRAARAVGGEALPGEPMRHDHRRILATGIARLRAKIKYRPVVFELMPAQFTLLQLQQAVEALAGRGLHKQNFRRLIEQQDLVERPATWPRHRRQAGQAVPVPPRRAAGTSHRGQQAAAVQRAARGLTKIMLMPSISGTRSGVPTQKYSL